MAAVFLSVAGGCSSPTKKYYLRHLSMTVEPSAVGDAIVAGGDQAAEPAVASVDPAEP